MSINRAKRSVAEFSEASRRLARSSLRGCHRSRSRPSSKLTLSWTLLDRSPDQRNATLPVTDKREKVYRCPKVASLHLQLRNVIGQTRSAPQVPHSTTARLLFAVTKSLQMEDFI